MRPRSLAFAEPDITPTSETDAACQAWRQMFVTFYSLQRQIEQLVTPRGLVLSQFEILVRAGLEPGQIQQTLAEALFLTKGNIGAMLDRLEHQHLIERRPDPDDKRVNRLYLTVRGRSLVAELMTQYRVLVRKMMMPLSESQQRQLRALLQLLAEGDTVVADA